MSWRQGRGMDLQAAVMLLVPTSHLEPFSVLIFIQILHSSAAMM